MRGRDREDPEHEAELISQPRLHLLDDRIRSAAERALVVAVLEQRCRCIDGSLDVVAVLADRERQFGLPLRAAHEPLPAPRPSSACRIPSAPGLTPTGET